MGPRLTPIIVGPASSVNFQPLNDADDQTAKSLKSKRISVSDRSMATRCPLTIAPKGSSTSGSTTTVYDSSSVTSSGTYHSLVTVCPSRPACALPAKQHAMTTTSAILASCMACLGSFDGVFRPPNPQRL